MVEMVGTVRMYDERNKRSIHERVKNTAAMIAESAGATADVRIESPYHVTVNDPKLTELMTPILKKVAGADNIVLAQKLPGAQRLLVLSRANSWPLLFCGNLAKFSMVAYNHSPLLT
jgi:amidohydrolase